MQNLVISERIKMLCKQRNISISFLLQKCNINKNFIYDLERMGKIPSVDKISAIAEYFDCSVDYLLGRKSGHNISTGDVANSNVISGSNNTLNEHLSLSTQEQDLVKIFREADGKTQIKIMQFMYSIGEN